MKLKATFDLGTPKLADNSEPPLFDEFRGRNYALKTSFRSFYHNELVIDFYLNDKRSAYFYVYIECDGYITHAENQAVVDYIREEITDISKVDAIKIISYIRRQRLLAKNFMNRQAVRNN
jgi:hypothetical protein